MKYKKNELCNRVLFSQDTNQHNTGIKWQGHSGTFLKSLIYSLTDK